MDNEIKLYTVTVFSENTVGLLNQITIIFTRRQLNIETLSVSPSALEGIHKFTITVNTTHDIIEKVVKQIDKRVGVIKSFFNVDENLVHQEIALYKIATSEVLERGTLEKLIYQYNAHILEITPDCVVLEKTGHNNETQEFFTELTHHFTVLQFVRSGRIAVTTSRIERLSDMLAELKEKLKKKNLNA
ncbi:MAG: acetolactate synthase small subunit [Paludibacteraceae bacterium]|nr:acetolactate synthase small subunit [Paludibacteraceae bacterium]